MKTRFLLIGLLSLIAVACADPELEVMTDKSDPVTTQSVRQRTLEEALTSAENWFAMMDDETRGIPRRIKSVEYVSSASRTRSGDIDTLMYLVNYDDDQGFALLGRPSTSKEIYAISGEGALDMSDTVYNKPLAMFMASAREDAQIAIPIPPGITLPPGMKDSLDYVSDTRLLRKVAPMLPDNVSKWSQGYPYNFYCKNINNHRGLVGCGPVAVGMLMAFYKQPTKIENSVYDWNRIIKDDLVLIVADFLEKISGEKYLNCSYKDWDNRITEGRMITRTFSQFGFGMGGVWNGQPLYGITQGQLIDNIQSLLDFMQVGTNLAKPAPVILWEEKIVNNQWGGDGHFWITDGYMEYEKFIPVAPELPGKKIDPLLHMIWGWGGTANGYYTYLKSSKLSPIEDPELESGAPNQYGNLGLYGKYITFHE